MLRASVFLLFATIVAATCVSNPVHAEGANRRARDRNTVIDDLFEGLFEKNHSHAQRTRWAAKRRLARELHNRARMTRMQLPSKDATVKVSVLAPTNWSIVNPGPHAGWSK